MIEIEMIMPKIKSHDLIFAKFIFLKQDMTDNDQI